MRRDFVEMRRIPPKEPVSRVLTFCICEAIVKFVWDERKRLLNLAKHGMDFYDAQRFFESHFTVKLDVRKEYGEERWQALGMIYGVVIVMVFTEPEEDVIRIISARRATKDEKAEYHRHFRS